MPFSDHHRHIDGPLLDTRRVTRRLAGTEIAVNEAVSTYLAWKLGEVVECESVSLVREPVDARSTCKRWT